MGIDTVKLRSPTIDEGLASFLYQQLILKTGVDLSTGEEIYAITSGQLEGSWDSRISFNVMRKDWVSGPTGRTEQVDCDPYILVETSLHKFFYGQNVFGQVENFGELCRLFIDLLGELFGCPVEKFGDPQGVLPSANRWQVRRVDWAEVFRLTPAAIAEFFRGISHCKFPRRSKNSAKYGENSVHFPGSHTTLRIYHKGPEFKAHEIPRVRKALTFYYQKQRGEWLQVNDWFRGQEWTGHNGDFRPVVEKKIKAMQRLADNRLRVEVQINAEKLAYDFGHYPLVSEITDEYLKKVHDDDVFKLMREGKTEMETVRTHDQVKGRLNSVYGKRRANSLFSFWLQMATRGETVMRDEIGRSQFYVNRRELVDAGVSWLASNVIIIANDAALPRDFTPMRSNARLCRTPVSSNSLFNHCPVEWGQLRAAA